MAQEHFITVSVIPNWSHLKILGRNFQIGSSVKSQLVLLCLVPCDLFSCPGEPSHGRDANLSFGIRAGSKFLDLTQ